MKKAKLIACSGLLSLLSLVAVVYTSCTKADSKTNLVAVDKCSGVVCLNTGVCSSGVCTCPTGYSGAHCELSTAIFKNNTPTPVQLKVNNVNHTLVVGDSIDIIDSSGKQIYTQVTTQDTFWDTLKWNDTLNFPINGAAVKKTIDVSPDNFYLKMINNSPKSILKFIVNYNLPHETMSGAPLNDGLIHGVGYFKSDSSISIFVIFTDATAKTFTGALPNTVNQTYTITLD